MFFFFKQKTAYEMRISDWSSDVCSSDLAALDAETRLLVRGERHLRVERTMLVDPDAAAFEPRRDFRGGGDIAAPDRAAEREGRGVGARHGLTHIAVANDRADRPDGLPVAHHPASRHPPPHRTPHQK